MGDRIQCILWKAYLWGEKKAITKPDRCKVTLCLTVIPWSGTASVVEWDVIKNKMEEKELLAYFPYAN